MFLGTFGELFTSFSLEGRITRKKYVYSFVAGIIGGILSILLIALLIGFMANFLPAFGGDKIVVGVLAILAIWPFVVLVSKTIQRCHDLGVSAYYLLIPFFFLFLFFTEGQNCPNEYGESPLKEETDKITLLNKGEESVAINKTPIFTIFKMFWLFLVLALVVVIVVSVVKSTL